MIAPSPCPDRGREQQHPSPSRRGGARKESGTWDLSPRGLEATLKGAGLPPLPPPAPAQNPCLSLCSLGSCAHGTGPAYPGGGPSRRVTVENVSRGPWGKQEVVEAGWAGPGEPCAKRPQAHPFGRVSALFRWSTVN